MKRTKVALIIAGAGTLSVVLGIILMLCEKSLQLSHMADIVTLFVLLGMAAGIVSFFFVGIGGVALCGKKIQVTMMRLYKLPKS